MTEPLRIALCAGGRSPEHLGSIESALYLLQYFDPNKYSVDFHYQMVTGRFASAQEISQYIDPWLNDPFIQAWDMDKGTRQEQEQRLRACLDRALRWTGDFWSLIEKRQYELVFPAFHGRFGEDGSLQGLLEFTGQAYAGCGVSASVLGIDKILTKDICRAAGLSTLPYVEIRRHKAVEKKISEAITNLTLPVFVKPARLGSSVGVQRANTESEAQKAVHLALSLDDRVLIEPMCSFQEYGIGLIGAYNPQLSSPIAFSLSPDFFDYQAKFGPQSTLDTIPAPLSPTQQNRLENFALGVWRELGLSGCARVDCFMKDEVIYLNEVNTLPGFGAHSVFGRAFADTGIPMNQVIDQIITCGLDAHKREAQLKTRYKEGL